MFSNRIKSGFLTLSLANQISFYCSSHIKSFFEKFSSLFYRNFHDYFKELLEKIKIIKKFKLFNEYEPVKKEKKNPLLKFFNDKICEKIDYQQKFDNNKKLIKKYQNKILQKSKKLEIIKDHIPNNILNGLKYTLNPFFKQYRVSTKRESKSNHFGLKKSNRKKTAKFFKDQNLFLKKLTKKNLNIPLIKKNGKEALENTILGFQSTLMDRMMFYKKNKIIYSEKKSLEGLKIPKCEIDQYFKSRIKENIPIKFGKNLKEIVNNLQTTNIKSNKVMNNCKSTLKMKKNEDLKDDMKFYFHINQNEMKHLDQVKDIIIKHKKSTKIKRNFEIYDNQKEENNKKEIKNDNYFIKKNNWKEIVLKRIIKKDKDYSNADFLKSSIDNKGDFKQNIAFMESKEIIKKYMEEIERKLMKQKKNKFRKKKNYSLSYKNNIRKNKLNYEYNSLIRSVKHKEKINEDRFLLKNKKNIIKNKKKEIFLLKNK